MAKLVDYLIDEVREATENEEFNDVVGLSEEEFIRFFNEGINRIHSLIIKQHPLVFTEEYTVSVTNGTQEYTLPRKAFNNNVVSQVEYSPTGLADDYYRLDPSSINLRHPGINGEPTHYIRRSGKVLLYPTPNSSAGSLRITYIRKPKKLDKRRGQIKAVTTSGSTITNLEINYINGTTVDSTELSKKTRFTVVDKYGSIKMDNILLSGITTSVSYDATITVDATFAFESTETIAVDDYIVSGEYVTSHLDVTETSEAIEEYIREFCRLRILQRDSSVDINDAYASLSAMEEYIVDSFKELTDDTTLIPDISKDLWFE